MISPKQFVWAELFSHHKIKFSSPLFFGYVMLYHIKIWIYEPQQKIIVKIKIWKNVRKTDYDILIIPKQPMATHQTQIPFVWGNVTFLRWTFASKTFSLYILHFWKLSSWPAVFSFFLKECKIFLSLEKITFIFPRL